MVIRKRIGNISPLREKDSPLLEKCKTLLQGTTIVKLKKKRDKERGTYYLLILKNLERYYYITILKSSIKGTYSVIPSKTTCDVLLFNQEGKNLKDAIRKLAAELRLDDKDDLIANL